MPLLLEERKNEIINHFPIKKRIASPFPIVIDKRIGLSPDDQYRNFHIMSDCIKGGSEDHIF